MRLWVVAGRNLDVFYNECFHIFGVATSFENATKIVDEIKNKNFGPDLLVHVAEIDSDKYDNRIIYPEYYTTVSRN